jgi:hypothetical protein
MKSEVGVRNMIGKAIDLPAVLGGIRRFARMDESSW